MNADILLSQRFVEKHADDAARALVSIDFSARLAFLNSLPPVHIGALLRRLDGSLAAQILGDIETERAVRALESLPSETSATLLRRLEAPEQQTLVSRMRASEREPLEQLLHYPENSAGALMNPRVFTLSPHLEAHAALAHVRAHSGAGHLLYLHSRRRPALIRRSQPARINGRRARRAHRADYDQRSSADRRPSLAAGRNCPPRLVGLSRLARD